MMKTFFVLYFTDMCKPGIQKRGITSTFLQWTLCGITPQFWYLSTSLGHVCQWRSNTVTRTGHETLPETLKTLHAKEMYWKRKAICWVENNLHKLFQTKSLWLFSSVYYGYKWRMKEKLPLRLKWLYGTFKNANNFMYSEDEYKQGFCCLSLSYRN